MESKNFGKMLIVIGILLVFVIFAFADWDERRGLFGNLRYSALICGGDGTYFFGSCLSPLITLGQGLIFPFSMIAIGLMISKNIIPEAFVARFLPFIIDYNTSPRKKANRSEP